MEKDRLTYKILARYMAGECSRQEEQEVEEWAKKNTDNAQKLVEFRRIWNMSKETDQDYEEFDAGAGWGKLVSRLSREEALKSASGKENYGSIQTVRTSIHSTARQFMRFAAIFLITGLAGFLVYQNLYRAEPATEQPTLREISTDRAQRVNLTLSDGTKVLLNAESTIKLPAHFHPDIREVFLQGQAYFNVAPDPEKPFLIHVSGTKIRVLGTSFSIRSYPEDVQVLVAVKEGRVIFEADNARDSQKAILTKGHLGRYHLDTQKIESGQLENIDRYLSWIDGHLRFDETSMYDVAVALERRYDVRVTFTDEEIRYMKVTAFLKSRSIKNVLNVITRSLHINYSLNDDRVMFFKKTNNLR